MTDLRALAERLRAYDSNAGLVTVLADQDEFSVVPRTLLHEAADAILGLLDRIKEIEEAEYQITGGAAAAYRRERTENELLRSERDSWRTECERNDEYATKEMNALRSERDRMAAVLPALLANAEARAKDIADSGGAPLGLWNLIERTRAALSEKPTPKEKG